MKKRRIDMDLKVYRARFVLFMLLFIPLSLSAQSSGSDEAKPPGVIVAERPDQTNSPELVPEGYLQWETGFVRELDRTGETKTINYLYNTSLIRYGVLTDFELRLQVEYAGQRIENHGEGPLVQGLNPVVVGTKVFICDQQGDVPQTSFSVSLTLPYFGSAQFKPRRVAPSLYFLFENEFSERLSLGYNVGIKWDGIAPGATGVVTASLGVSVSRRVSAFVEGYLFAAEKTDPDQRADCGLSYLVANNFVVDVSGGWGVNDKAPDSFISFGLSWRLPN